MAAHQRSSLRRLALGLFLIASAQLSSAYPEPETGKALIEETCSDTNYYDLCVSSFESDARSEKASYKDLGPIKLQLLLKNASDTGAEVRKLMAEAETPAMKKALSSCYDIYTSMVGTLNAVKGRFEKLDFQPIVAAMRSAEEAATECEGEFKKVGVKSPLTERNRIANEMADNGFVIISNMMV